MGRRVGARRSEVNFNKRLAENFAIASRPLSRDQLAVKLVSILLAGVIFAPGANADNTGAGQPRHKSHCKIPVDAHALWQSDAAKDFYNSLAWGVGTGAIHWGTTPATRWTRTNGFDSGIRGGLRLGSANSRKDADFWSDITLVASTGLLPLSGIFVSLRHGDCLEAWDMATDLSESLTLSFFITASVKAIAGRERPYVRECDGSPPSDANCNDANRKLSFFSGHASAAAAGAGVTCAYAIKRKAWGESTAAQVFPCALGIGAAFTTGILRIAADKHWGTDVLVGLIVGGAVGYFDTWGPFDFLKFESHSASGARDVRGVILPYAGSGEIGARMALVF